MFFPSSLKRIGNQLNINILYLKLLVELALWVFDTPQTLFPFLCSRRRKLIVDKLTGFSQGPSSLNLCLARRLINWMKMFFFNTKLTNRWAWFIPKGKKPSNVRCWEAKSIHLRNQESALELCTISQVFLTFSIIIMH